MGKVSRKKGKLSKAAKSAKLDSFTHKEAGGESIRNKIDEAYHFFKHGDASTAKQIIKAVLKVIKFSTYQKKF